MAENVKEALDREPKWETVSGAAFLDEVRRCVQNVKMQSEHPMEAEQLLYAFDQVRIKPLNGALLEFADAAYTISNDERFVDIGRRGHGMRDARSLSKVGGTIENQISVFVATIMDPNTKIEVKRRQEPRTSW